jgi:hypothetical protein
MSRARALPSCLAAFLAGAGLAACTWNWNIVRPSDAAQGVTDAPGPTPVVCVVDGGCTNDQTGFHLGCAASADSRLACRAELVCNARGDGTGHAWQTVQPPPLGCALDAGDCASAIAGAACHPASAICATDGGLLCQCRCGTSGPCVTAQWSCSSTTSAAAGCPAASPQLGDLCDAGAGLECDYGACTGGWALLCVNGHWELPDAGPSCH